MSTVAFFLFQIELCDWVACGCLRSLASSTSRLGTFTGCFVFVRWAMGYSRVFWTSSVSEAWNQVLPGCVFMCYKRAVHTFSLVREIYRMTCPTFFEHRNQLVAAKQLRTRVPIGGTAKVWKVQYEERTYYRLRHFPLLSNSVLIDGKQFSVVAYQHGGMVLVNGETFRDQPAMASSIARQVPLFSFSISNFFCVCLSW